MQNGLNFCIRLKYFNMATNEKSICVIGDSFAGNRNNAEWNKTDKRLNKDWSWVNLLEANNSGEFNGRSYPGQSYFHQRRWYYYNMIFHNEHDTSDTILVLVHTNHGRLPHMRDLPITGQVVFADKHDPKSNELYKADPSGRTFDFAHTFYLSQFYVDEFYFSAFTSWLAELPELTKHYKKVIHLFGFETKLNTLPNFMSRFYVGKLLTPNSVVVQDTLVSLSMAERGSREWGGPDVGPDRQNHFNKHNNECLFNELTYIINNVPGGTFHKMDLSKWDLKDRSLLETMKLYRDGFDPLDPVCNPLL